MEKLQPLLLKDLEARYPRPDPKLLDARYYQAIEGLNLKIVVLDDDPTGVQTVHGVSVYTSWTEEMIASGFAEKSSLFYILTNSRSFTREKTAAVHREIARTIASAAKRTGQEYLLISRGDSTLRGHYPLETETLRHTLEAESGVNIDGEILIPFFQEGGRFTVNDTHYVCEENVLIPAGATEFAKDKTFGYTQSHLGEWIEEKTAKRYRAQEVIFISLQDLREESLAKIENQLRSVNNFGKIVVNALDYSDLKVFMLALAGALNSGKKYIFRTAASFVKVIGGIADRGLLAKEDLVDPDNPNGGLVLIGSHVRKTTEQLEELQKCKGLRFIEFNQHLVLEPEKLAREVDRVVGVCEEAIGLGRTAVVFTRRERLDLNCGDQEAELRIAVDIADAVTAIVTKLKVRPRYIIAKGGITSSDIGSRGLHVQRAVVAGQIKPGIPVWRTGSESKFPGLPFVIFPGNVGNRETLKEIVEMLEFPKV